MKNEYDDEIEEKHYNDAKRRFEEPILIYEEKKVEEILERLTNVERKVSKLISMLTAHDYETKRLMKK